MGSAALASPTPHSWEWPVDTDEEIGSKASNPPDSPAGVVRRCHPRVSMLWVGPVSPKTWEALVPAGLAAWQSTGKGSHTEREAGSR